MRKITAFLILFGFISFSCVKDKTEPIDDSLVIIFSGHFGSKDYSAINTKDNNIAICGHFEDGDGISNIIKLTENGEVIWKKYFRYRVNSLVQDKYSNYFLCGNASISHADTSHDYTTVVIKTDSKGDTLWTKLYDYSKNNDGINILETKDGNILVAGVANFWGVAPEVLLTKIDYDGNLIWRRVYKEAFDFRFRHILETNKGDFLITATSGNGISYGMHLTKLNTNGEVLWNKEFVSDNRKIGNCSIELPDNSLIVCGDIKINNITQKTLILKMDSDGNIIWEKHYGENNTKSTAVSMKLNNDGTIVMTGEHYAENGGIMFLKIDENGNQITFNKLGAIHYENACNIVNNVNRGYLIAGYRVIGSAEEQFAFITRVFDKNDTINNNGL